MKFFRITKWERYQHYHSPRPKWIKLYTSINDLGTDWYLLNDTEIGQLIRLLVYAANHDNTMPYNTELIQGLLGFSEPVNLERFVELGVIEVFNTRDECASIEFSRVTSRANQPPPSSEIELELREESKSKKKKPPNPLDVRAEEAAGAVAQEFNITFGRDRGPTKTLVRAIKAILKEHPKTTVDDFVLVVRSRVTEDWVQERMPPIESMLRVHNFAGYLERAKEMLAPSAAKSSKLSMMEEIAKRQGAVDV